MADEALRSVFAEFGIAWNSEALEKGQQRVDAAASSVKNLALSKLGEKLAARLNTLSPAFGRMAQKFGLGAGEMAGLAKVVTAASVATVASFTGMAVAAFHFANGFAAAAEELRDTARDLKLTTTELQEMRFAAAQSGVGVDRMASAMRKFRGDLNQAERWGNGTTSMLKRLGVQARDGSGHIRPMGDLMNDLAVALDRVPNPARRTRIAVRLFGEEGRRMLDVLHSGPGGLAALRDELGELGGGVTPEAAEAARAYTLATNRLNVAQDSLRSVLAAQIIPALTWLVGKTVAVAVGFVKLTRGTHVFEVALGAVAVVGTAAALAMIVAWAPVVAPFLLAAAAVAGVVLQVDDLITLFEGGDSTAGRFLDTLFGAGTAATQVRYLREEFQELVNSLSENLWVLGPLAELTSLAAVEKPAAGRLGARFAARQALRQGTAPPTTTNVRGSLGGPDAPTEALVTPVPRLPRGLQQVPGIGSLVQPVRNTTISRDLHIAPGAIVVQDTSNGRLVARDVMRQLDERQRRERDAAHPEPAEE